MAQNRQIDRTILCAQKLTDASLIYRKEPQTKNRKELKTKMDLLRRNGARPETVESVRTIQPFNRDYENLHKVPVTPFNTWPLTVVGIDKYEVRKEMCI